MTFRLLNVLLFIPLFITPSQLKYSAQEVMERVRGRYSRITDASARFTQHIKTRFVTNEQIQNGTVKIKKGNKYRIEAEDQKLISNGKTVWIVSQTNNQVLIDSYKENSRIFSPDKFLTGLPDDFSPAALEQEGEFLKLSLEPKAANSQTRQIASLITWVNPKNWIVEKIEYADRSRTVYTITLTDVVFDSGLTNKIFEFEPSADMKVIDMRNFK